MKAWGCWAVLAIAATAARMQAGVEGREAMDVTVRLFSTAPVRAVELSGAGSHVRLCTRCAAQVLSVPLRVVAVEGGGLSVAGRSVARLWVEGQVRAGTADGRSAQVAGRWSVAGARDGLHVTVQVPSERYVMAVLQGETAGDEPLESLKALAVVVRSFAMSDPERHGVEGLCDSTHCQALRFGPVPARVREAVEATSGETLWWSGKTPQANRQVAGYFTQNCGGRTEDASAAWGGERKPWLVAQPDPFCVRTPALWHAELGLKELHDALAAEGFAVPAAVASVRAVATDEGERATALEIAGAGMPRSEGTGGAKANGQSRLRVKAATLRFALNRAFGWNQLRSDRYRVRVAGERVVFDGRGYGHGVGLCQAGARVMAAQGKSYREVLRFYFPGTAVRVQPGDTGWASRQGAGWTLRAVRDGNEWIRAGDAAWARARRAFPVAGPVQPVVTVYPTTELFREATGHAGWELAATRGDRVALQPENVVVGTSCASTPGRQDLRGSQRCGAESLLLHEFLHVLVESDAAPNVPLWLREGLVEVLAGDGDEVVNAQHDMRQANQGLSAADIGAGLAETRSWAASQRAHAAARRMAGRALVRYGMAAVRGWLRNGVAPGAVLQGRVGE